MYSTCLFCHSDLGSNEVIESFPIGRRLAFDAATGRLWVICRKCERWNLTPIEERWEAVEQCEKMFTSTRLRVSSDNIGMSRLSEGLELVRIGKPLRPEMAAWRYGDQFGRRRTKHLAISGGVAVLAVGLVIVGPATGMIASGGYGMFQLVNAIQKAARDRIVRARIAVPGRDRPAVLNGKDIRRVVLGVADGAWTLRMPYGSKKTGLEGTGDVTFTGADALRAAASVMPAVNLKGATKDEVADAVRFLERTPDANELFQTAARIPTARKKRRDGSFKVFGSQASMKRYQAVSFGTDAARLGVHEAFVDRLPQPIRLALEMAAHEDIERRAMEGELSVLEQAWRDADEIASISDSMFVSDDVAHKLEALKTEK